MSDSSKSVADFLTQLSTDETFRTRLTAGTLEELLAAAAAEGYQFTAADLEAALPTASPGGEVISDIDLEQVSGGIHYGSSLQLVKKFFDD